MKSSLKDLQKRGYATQADIVALRGTAQEILFSLLNSDSAVIRTAAACNLSSLHELTADQLLNRLSVEKCLYTKIAICEALEQGNEMTAKVMCHYLGTIGNNQHKQLPEKVSRKKSYPLPRDIIARSLGKMNPAIFPVLLKVVKSDDVSKISEVLDAGGFMAFYHLELVNDNNLQVIVEAMDRCRENDLIIWKSILCLSAFSLPKSNEILCQFTSRNDLLVEEARRSLRLIQSKRKG